ncbi:MAG TPA: galactose-1-phosphate uridylyltransferase [Acidimicrobiia bacterium]|nr:galactose-1-phosphate uridylyltransferase [Acidimicrobiia bacterium]
MELRHDPVSGRVVIIAPERDARPHASRELGARESTPASCPFCPGNEDATPPEVYRTGPGASNTPGWRVRVAPNLFPIVGGLHAAHRAGGAHEVIVLSPDHDRSFAGLSDDEAVEVLTVARDRARYHLDAGLTYVQILVNHGREAGASLAHTHAQLVALDFVPPAVLAARDRLDAAEMDTVAAQRLELEDGPFSVIDGAAAVWCPPASGSPYEMRIAHADAEARFDDSSDDVIAAIAVALRDGLARLAAVVGDAPYNVVVHSATRDDHSAFAHWYVGVHPRLSVRAGFELGTGVDVNVVAPEAAAARLRDAQ